jgi:hypothetical protein
MRKDKLMHQVATSLIFAAAACTGIGVIVLMLKENGAAILSALAGNGAFPMAPAPEKGPAAAHKIHLARPSRRGGRRGGRVSNLPDWAIGLSHAA